jgi:hypothetical protein
MENTAQNDLIAYLENAPPQINEIRISEPLKGDLDFDVLAEYGIRTISSIVLAPGEITSVRNIPASVTSFECPNNQLANFVDLPDNLVVLDVHDNRITSIDLSKLGGLKTLNVSNNQLTALDSIPASIETILCDNNQIKRIDLSTATQIQVLHCANNPFIQIVNPPATLRDFVMDESAISKSIDESAVDNDDDAATMSNRKDFMESLYDYFRLKSNYEKINYEKRKDIYKNSENKKEARKLLAEFKPKCVNCKRAVGSIFTTSDRRYLAKCGDAANPCPLDIEIFLGYFENIRSELAFFKETLEKSKGYIIQQKLDTLFDYVTEEEAVAEFKENLETYNESSVYYNQVKTKYDEIFSNVDKHSEIRAKENEIKMMLYDIDEMVRKYKETEEPQFLRDAIEQHVNNLMPMIDYVRRMKYPTMRIITDKEKMVMENEQKGSVETEQTIEVKRLYQLEYTLNQLDFTIGENPEVIKYIGPAI